MEASDDVVTARTVVCKVRSRLAAGGWLLDATSALKNLGFEICKSTFVAIEHWAIIQVPL
jgi:hypothetical protein